MAIQHPFKSNVKASANAYDALILRIKKRRIISLVTSILAFGFLSYLSAQGLIQTHWFTFLLFSIASGCWILFISQLISWLSFLHLRLKSQLKRNTQTYPLANALKKARKSALLFCGSNGLFIFSLFIFLAQKSDKDGVSYALRFGDVFFFIAVSSFLALMIFVIVTVFSAFILRIDLIPNSSRRYQQNFLDSLDYGPPPHLRAEQLLKEQEPDIAAQCRKNWDHDPMNPGSAEYQSTYRLWWHHED